MIIKRNKLFIIRIMFSKHQGQIDVLELNPFKMKLNTHFDAL